MNPNCFTSECYRPWREVASAITRCFRRNAGYYWRRWTPAPRRELLQVSLGVKEARTARILSSLLTARSDCLFSHWMSGRMNKDQLLAYRHRVLDPAQLVRIEAVHRGFLFQHLYEVPRYAIDTINE